MPRGVKLGKVLTQIDGKPFVDFCCGDISATPSCIDDLCGMNNVTVQIAGVTACPPSLPCGSDCLPGPPFDSQSSRANIGSPVNGTHILPLTFTDFPFGNSICHYQKIIEPVPGEDEPCGCKSGCSEAEPCDCVNWDPATFPETLIGNCF